ncbi:hypothetical protein [Kibdelosporangium phytohabitans]|uniref:Lipoprotein CseA n=1 Tax=Kibdelosporangium phytohabitans TaxID=860235 RepID=A0A0N9HZE9_9PSEU|nr:hypothetical protein [Kibdelosporangium phytohabitans]ALG07248.1 hypothetical protein AOZ06_10235 [Kibdelosporangium phytohabitans]MBE1471894.1 hypothetical protein [Kibdelosporangium phytohabitans]
MRRLALGLCCLTVLLAGCATAGGVRVEGAAIQVTPPPSTPPPPSGVTPSFDPVALLRTDPKVSDKIKNHLTPCNAGRFPVDARYADVTGDDVPELLVEVTACDQRGTDQKPVPSAEYARGNGVIANYVYDVVAKPPVDLFALEEPAVLVDVGGKGGLQMVHWEYRSSDRSWPSQQISKFYRWTGTAFELVKR